MAALLGFIEESHEKLKQGPALYQTSLDLTELIAENTSKIIMLKYLNSEFTICIAVELFHKNSNFAIPTSMMNLRKQKKQQANQRIYVPRQDFFKEIRNHLKM